MGEGKRTPAVGSSELALAAAVFLGGMVVLLMVVLES
jgi:hypothetical protein